MFNFQHHKLGKKRKKEENVFQTEIYHQQGKMRWEGTCSAYVDMMDSRTYEILVAK
jgi:hypothetical protein